MDGWMIKSQDEHEFMVAGVEPAMIQGIAITLIDARGGRVRLHLTTEMAECFASVFLAHWTRCMGRDPCILSNAFPAVKQPTKPSMLGVGPLRWARLCCHTGRAHRRTESPFMDEFINNGIIIVAVVFVALGFAFGFWAF